MNTIRLGGIQYLNLIPDFKKIRAEQRAETHDHPAWPGSFSKTRDHLLSGQGARLAFNNTNSIEKTQAHCCLLLLSCYKLFFQFK